MSLKRVWGILLGIVVGVIPLINTVAASIFAYRLKKKKWMRIYVITSCVTLLLMVLANVYANKEKPIKAAFPATFQKNLQAVAVKRDALIDSVEMETILKQVLTNTANQLIQDDKKRESLLQHARNGSLSEKPKAAFHKLSQYFYEDYLNKVKAGTGKDKNDLTFDTAKLWEDQQTAGNIANFVSVYLESEHEVSSLLIGGLALVSLVIGCVGCISNSANLFVRSGVEAADTFRTGAGEGAVTGSFNRQPPPATRRDEPVPAQSQRTPPPLPQASTSAGMVNVNAAEENELMQLRGINRILAKTIISERSVGGNFTDIDDLEKRLELSAEQVDRIRGSVEFDAPKRGGGRVIEF